VKTDDDVVARIEHKDAAAVDGQNDVIARQRRTFDAVRLEHRRKVSRPYQRRADDQLVLDLHPCSHVIHGTAPTNRVEVIITRLSNTAHLWVFNPVCLLASLSVCTLTLQWRHQLLEVAGAKRVWGTEVPKRDPWAQPRWESGGETPRSRSNMLT